MELNWKKDIWVVLDNYFNTINNYLSRNQLDSYNTFLDKQVSKTIRQFNPIELPYAPFNDSNNHKFEIKIIVGGSISDDIDFSNFDDNEIINDGKNVYIGKPTIQHKLNNKETIGDSKSNELATKQLFPNEARLKNLTYKTEISADIIIILKINDIDGNILNKKLKIFKNVILGYVPIMLQSKACVLNGMPKNILNQMGECEFDQGGYFIIDGKEKVIVAQERQVENKLYIKKSKSIDDKFSYECEIRSVPENIFQPARITKLIMYKLKNNSSELIMENSIRLSLLNFDEDIPIFIFFRALGVVSDKDIVKCIINNKNSKLDIEIMKLLRSSIAEAGYITNQYLALEFLKSKLLVYGKSPPENMKTIYIQDVLRNYLIPHVGTNYLYKAYFIGYMVRELIITKLNIKPITDRDSFINKRVDIAGFLVGEHFRNLYFRMQNELIQIFNRKYSEEEYDPKQEGKYWDLIDKSGEINFFNLIGDKDSVLSKLQINKVFKRKIIDEGFMYAFKNCWGLKNAPCKQGVVQDLNRMNPPVPPPRCCCLVLLLLLLAVAPSSVLPGAAAGGGGPPSSTSGSALLKGPVAPPVAAQ